MADVAPACQALSRAGVAGLPCGLTRRPADVRPFRPPAPAQRVFAGRFDDPHRRSSSRAARALRQPAVAVTDQNNLFALVKFYKAAEAAGIKPIAGADLLARRRRRSAPTRADAAVPRPRRATSPCRGCSSRAWMEGHRGDGVVVRPGWLRDANAGLFALAGRAQRSRPPRCSRGKHDLAAQWLADWQRAHSGERLHLELTRTQRDGEDAFNRVRAARSRDARHSRSSPATTCASSSATDFDAHEARVCITTGRVLDDPKRPHDYSAEQYLKSLGGDGGAVRRSARMRSTTRVELAKRCNLELSLRHLLPARVPGARRRNARQLDPQPGARRPAQSAWPSIAAGRGPHARTTTTHGWKPSSTSSSRWASPATS